MIKGKEFHGIINRIFNEDVKGYLESQQLQVNCPRCQQREGRSSPDGKYNLEINTAKRLFRCWKCDEPIFSGSLGRLIKTLGTYSDFELYKSYGGTTYTPLNEDEDEDIFIDVSVPTEFISFAEMNPADHSHMQAYMYMITQRKLDKETLLRYRVGFCTTGKYANRIIIPSYNINGEINYFVSRAYRKGMIPYLNPKVEKDLFIFNDGLINWDSTIYLVEGVFEMFSVVNGIPLLGKTLGKTLFYKLKEKKPNVVIVLDPDAYKNAIEIYQKLLSVYVGCEDRVKIVKLKGERDLDEIRTELGNDQVIKELYEATGLDVEDYIKMRSYNRKNAWGNRFKRTYQ